MDRCENSMKSGAAFLSIFPPGTHPGCVTPYAPKTHYFRIRFAAFCVFFFCLASSAANVSPFAEAKVSQRKIRFAETCAGVLWGARAWFGEFNLSRATTHKTRHGAQIFLLQVCVREKKGERKHKWGKTKNEARKNALKEMHGGLESKNCAVNKYDQKKTHTHSSSSDGRNLKAAYSAIKRAAKESTTTQQEAAEVCFFDLFFSVVFGYTLLFCFRFAVLEKTWATILSKFSLYTSLLSFTHILFCFLEQSMFWYYRIS